MLTKGERICEKYVRTTRRHDNEILLLLGPELCKMVFFWGQLGDGVKFVFLSDSDF